MGLADGAREIARALRDFLGLPTIVAQDPDVAATALSWAEQGMDFADALHLAGAAHCEGFASFDRDLARIAKRLGASKIRTP
jgi:predicted nucleic acid-binding protein